MCVCVFLLGDTSDPLPPAPPDTRDLLLPGEVFTFWAEHAVLVALPLLYMWQRRFVLYKPRILLMWGILFLYHVDVLLPVSFISGGNLNYMMVRSPLLPPCGALWASRLTCVSM